MLRASGNATGISVLSKTGIPFVKAPSGTMANNGAITLGTALPRILARCYLWLPASSIAAGSAAGWYWTVMSSTTVGQVFNSQYVSGTPVAGTATPFVTTGPGAFTGDTGEVFGPTITVPANALGANGALWSRGIWSFTPSAGVKTPRLRYSGNAGTVLFTEGSWTTVVNANHDLMVQNNGATNAQVAMGWDMRASNGSLGLSAVNTASVDTTAATTLVTSLQTAVATDWLIHEAFSLIMLTDGT